jgi:hypothetical protein
MPKRKLSQILANKRRRSFAARHWTKRSKRLTPYQRYLARRRANRQGVNIAGSVAQYRSQLNWSLAKALVLNYIRSRT